MTCFPAECDDLIVFSGLECCLSTKVIIVERQIGHFSNYCYRGDRALKIAMGGYFEVNFSFLRVPVNSFEQGPLFWPRIALFWARNSKRFEKCIFYV